jgi:hypothetical protein
VSHLCGVSLLQRHPRDDLLEVLHSPDSGFNTSDHPDCPSCAKTIFERAFIAWDKIPEDEKPSGSDLFEMLLREYTAQANSHPPGSSSSSCRSPMVLLIDALDEVLSSDQRKPKLRLFRPHRQRAKRTWECCLARSLADLWRWTKLFWWTSHTDRREDLKKGKRRGVRGCGISSSLGSSCQDASAQRRNTFASRWQLSRPLFIMIKITSFISEKEKTVSPVISPHNRTSDITRQWLRALFKESDKQDTWASRVSRSLCGDTSDGPLATRREGDEKREREARGRASSSHKHKPGLT